ncbi:LysR family transcriptional regulator [Acidovorax sp. sif1233]|uniref:LysR family transcriptional regulator n=1 Tax=unclassified Acidovorax TaxID=2684926 RepID=UPI001C43B8B8|nr:MULTISPECIES: LysR family transcriptional regulator [unclassified Acidovorax]MBV7430747.1 LysR family transcriptional regulator [Acidovorax sp. sif0732]MBV7451853.1 LysR family transcriptional regulator [Acidovorax sp. sif0715]MBV7457262.1 LysR family transcriptional regulator [Acidovorax sp. sif1233]
MELRQLRYLIGVCEAGGVLAASKTLHVAQPALSQSISSLEGELGVQLFVRTNRGMTLTDAGRTMLEHARVVLADIERARSAVQHSALDIQGEMAVGLPTTVALVATLPILRATRTRYPKLKLKIIESHSGFLGEWLRAGRLDLSVLFVSGNEPAFEYRLLLEERLALVTTPQDTPATREISLKSLASRPLVLPAQEHGLRRIIDRVCAEHGVELEVIAEIDSLPNIKKAVQEGMASTILSPGAVADEVQAGHLAVTTITRPHIPRQVACATSMTRPVTPATAAMISLVTEEMRSLVEQGLWPAEWIGDAPA